MLRFEYVFHLRNTLTHPFKLIHLLQHSLDVRRKHLKFHRKGSFLIVMEWTIILDSFDHYIRGRGLTLFSGPYGGGRWLKGDGWGGGGWGCSD